MCDKAGQNQLGAQNAGIWSNKTLNVRNFPSLGLPGRMCKQFKKGNMEVSVMSLVETRE